MLDYIVTTNSICKAYGNRTAVNNISIHVKKGAIYGLIGRNGAGKTTLMKLLLGLTKPDNGEIIFDGYSDLNKARRNTGSLIEAPALYKNETALENMKRFSLLTKSSDNEIKEILSLVGLDNTGKKAAGSFSLGMKQRLGIAIAMLGNPNLLILDEPINGLDPAGIKDIRDTIVTLNKKGVTFIISSHLLDELGKIATDYGIINNAELVEEISSNELNKRCCTSLTIKTNSNKNATNILLENYPELKNNITYTYDGITITCDNPQSALYNKTIINNNIDIYETYFNHLGFEDFFIEKIGH